MLYKRELTSNAIPLTMLGVDPSSANGAHLQAIRIRRYWLERGIDVPVERVVTVHRIEERGLPRSMSRTVYGVKAHFNEARKVSGERQLLLLAALEDEAEVYV